MIKKEIDGITILIPQTPRDEFELALTEALDVSMSGNAHDDNDISKQASEPKVYVQPGQKPPSNEPLKVGSKGGHYYNPESTPGSQPQAPVKTPSGVRVPPNWRNVQISKDDKSPLQATGIDSKGRRVYLYSAEHASNAAAVKFNRLKEFSKALISLTSKINRDFGSTEEAKVLYLIERTGFRIGSTRDTKAAKQAYGASTLSCSHVKITGNSLEFDFTAKKGVHVDKTIVDGKLAEEISNKCKSKNDAPIFNTNDVKVREYLHRISGKPFEVKDFRTYIGTTLAQQLVNNIELPKNEKELSRSKKFVAAEVSKVLGNTPAVALKAYIAPEVFTKWTSQFGAFDELKKSNDFDVFNDVFYDVDSPWEEFMIDDPDETEDDDNDEQAETEEGGEAEDEDEEARKEFGADIQKRSNEEISKMIEIMAPKKVKKEGKLVFLAGSIDMGAAEDWQSRVVNEFENEKVTFLNPRREDWDKSWKQDIENPEFREQVQWELDNQRKADVIAMYFAPDSKSPISLLELGLFADTGKMIVCCPDGFYRKGNVDIVCKKYNVEEVETFKDFIAKIREKLNASRFEKQSPGNFSVMEQAPTETGNQVSPPRKVHYQEKGGEDVEDNKEAYFEKQQNTEEKIYVQPGQKAPKGYSTKKGKRGGEFYNPKERQGQPQEQASEKTESPEELAQEGKLQVNYEAERDYREELLSKLKSHPVSYAKLDNTITPESVTALKENVDSYLGQYERFFDATSFNKARTVLYDVVNSASKTKRLTPSQIQELTNDSADKLIYQETIAWQTQMSDHGIRHIYGNVNFSNRMMDAMEKAGVPITPEDRLINDIVMVNHDIGYTCEMSRGSPVPWSKVHPQTGKMIFEGERDFFSKFFSEDELKKMGDYIEKHQSSTLDWENNRALTIISLSDNLSIFHEEKLPSLFKYIDGSLDDLFDIQIAIQNNNADGIEAAKKSLEAKVMSAQLPAYTKSWLMRAAEEVTGRTAKFTIPMLLGSVKHFGFSKDSGLTVDIDEDPMDERVAQYFNMGQENYEKLAESYGTILENNDDIKMTKDGKQLLNIKFTRHPDGYHQQIKKSNESQIQKGFDSDSDALFDRIDTAVMKMSHMMQPVQKLPRGAKKLAESLELSLYSNLRKKVNDWFDSVEKDSDVDGSLSSLRLKLLDWNTIHKLTSKSDIQEFWQKGYLAGVSEASLEPSIQNKGYMADKDNGINPALDRLRDNVFKDISTSMVKYRGQEIPLYSLKRDIDSKLRGRRNDTRRILKTEVAKAANLGLIDAWGEDPERYSFEYFWNAVIDDKTKKISQIRKEYNPLTYDEIEFLWKNQSQLIDGNHWEDDQFFQRCSISRELGSSEHKGNRFATQRHEFRSTL